MSLAHEDVGLPNTPTARTLFLLSEKSNDESDAEYNSDVNAGPSFEQVEGEPSIENYLEDEAVSEEPDTNPISQEENRIQTDNEIGNKRKWLI